MPLIYQDSCIKQYPEEIDNVCESNLWGLTIFVNASLSFINCTTWLVWVQGGMLTLVIDMYAFAREFGHKLVIVS